MNRIPSAMVGDDARSLHLVGEKLETPHVVTYHCGWDAVHSCASFNESRKSVMTAMPFATSAVFTDSSG